MPKFRTIYLYLFSMVGLVLIIIGSVQLINLGLKAYVFKKADEQFIFVPPSRLTPEGEEIEVDEELEEQRQREATSSRRQRDAAQAISLLIVGVPLYIYHWKLVQKDKNI